MDGADLIALWISFRLAATTTLLLLLLCTPLAWWLAMGNSRWRVVVDAVVSLPLVLPPTVLGFYLLVLLGPFGGLGRMLHWLGMPAPAFTFSGLVIGSMLYSLPFAVQTLRDAFLAAGPRAPAVAHTLGEFGVVLMIGGNIPGRTQTASIALFNHAEALEYAAAYHLSEILLAVCFLLLLAVYTANRRLRATGM